jgi:hypothetical protein
MYIHVSGPNSMRGGEGREGRCPHDAANVKKKEQKVFHP